MKTQTELLDMADKIIADLKAYQKALGDRDLIDKGDRAWLDASSAIESIQYSKVELAK